MLRIVAAVAAVAVGATVVYAQNADAIKQRRQVMRDIVKSGTGEVFKMTKGELPFDLVKVQGLLATVQTEMPKLKTLFPDNSKEGNTGASAKIWSDRAGFDAAVDTFAGIAKAAAGAIKDEASFKAEYGKVGSGCGACHKATDGYTSNLGESFKSMRDPL